MEKKNLDSQEKFHGSWSWKFFPWVFRKGIASVNSTVNFNSLVPEPFFVEARGTAVPRKVKASGQQTRTLCSRHTAH